jgi:hypothetical protein
MDSESPDKTQPVPQAEAHPFAEQQNNGEEGGDHYDAYPAEGQLPEDEMYEDGEEITGALVAMR